MAFSSNGVHTALATASAIEEGKLYGINSNTACKDERAWRMWEYICSQHGTSPLRTAEDARQFPERNSHLLAALLMHAFVTCKPRTKGRHFIKPRSALAYPLAIVRIFHRWSVQMPSFKAIKASYAHIARLYISYHGPYSMAPKRAEPMKYSMVLAMHSIPEGTQLGNWVWRADDHDTIMFKTLNAVLWPTAHRLGEVVRHSSGEIMYFTFESLVWSVAGVLVAAPSPAQLALLVPGRDYALLFPPRSKPDQWGEIHCPFPSVLMFHNEPANGAALLRDVELSSRCSPEQRQATPLFHDQQRQPYTHTYLDQLLKKALAHCFGAAAAKLYTWHSYRSGLATALHAAGVPDGEIQLICRWMCPESLHVYRRMGITENAHATQLAMRTHVHSVQQPNVQSVLDDVDYSSLNRLTRAQLTEVARRNAARVRAARSHAPTSSHAAGAPMVSADQVWAATSLDLQAVNDHAFLHGDAVAESPSPRKRRRPVSPPPASPPPTPARVFLAPSRMWPAHACHENDGRGWSVEVLATSGASSLVRFVHARTPDGRPYAPCRVLTSALEAG